MSRPAAQGLSPSQLAELFVRHRRWWIVPTLGIALLAGVVSLAMPRKWKATQGLLIRPEAAGLGVDRLGKFSDLSEMKTIQETLLELARSKTVVSAALEAVGPPSSLRAGKPWPTAQDVADFRDAMVMTPPGGAEFGKTEVFYLGVLDKDPQRAAALTRALATALEERTQQVREKQADSMIAELAEGLEQAEAQWNLKIQQLAAFEGSVGANLNDLRSLVNPIGGSSESSQNNLAIKAEIRANDTERRRNEKLLSVLRQAQADPETLIATPASLLTSQPAVERLKQGLVDTQLATARLLGNLAPAHPFVLAAEESESNVRQQLHQELAAAIHGLEIELALSDDHRRALESRLDHNLQTQRLLAQHRAEYSQLVAAVDNQTQLVDAARTRLVDAQGHLAGARSASVLSRIDDVESGLRPVGPSRSTVVAAGGLLGMLLGCGLIFWKYGPEPVSGSELDATEATRPSPPATRTIDFEFSNSPRQQATISEAIAAGINARRTAGVR